MSVLQIENTYYSYEDNSKDSNSESSIDDSESSIDPGLYGQFIVKALNLFNRFLDVFDDLINNYKLCYDTTLSIMDFKKGFELKVCLLEKIVKEYLLYGIPEVRVDNVVYSLFATIERLANYLQQPCKDNCKESIYNFNIFELEQMDAFYFISLGISSYQFLKASKSNKG